MRFYALCHARNKRTLTARLEAVRYAEGKGNGSTAQFNIVRAVSFGNQCIGEAVRHFTV